MQRLPVFCKQGNYHNPPASNKKLLSMFYSSNLGQFDEEHATDCFVGFQTSQSIIEMKKLSNCHESDCIAHRKRFLTHETTKSLQKGKFARSTIFCATLKKDEVHLILSYDHEIIVRACLLSGRKKRFSHNFVRPPHLRLPDYQVIDGTECLEKVKTRSLTC